MKTAFQLACILMMTATNVFAQQSPAEMQSQMNAADQPQSAASSTLYKTPLKSYQRYYTAFVTNKTKDLLACYNTALQLKTLDGAPSTEEYFSQVDAKMAHGGLPAFQLLSFIFTANNQRPKVTIVVSEAQGSDIHKEQISLTMVDTEDGWKIDDLTTTELN